MAGEGKAEKTNFYAFDLVYASLVEFLISVNPVEPLQLLARLPVAVRREELKGEARKNELANRLGGPTEANRRSASEMHNELNGGSRGKGTVCEIGGGRGGGPVPLWPGRSLDYALSD